jgi:hypothetical protein
VVEDIVSSVCSKKRVYAHNMFHVTLELLDACVQVFGQA